jgi:hypothetical protein
MTNCTQCDNLFDINDHIPIGLPCGHTHCKECLNTQWRKLAYIKCSTCNKKHFQSLDQFQVNDAFFKILQYSSSSSLPPSPSKLYIIVFNLRKIPIIPN